jgi:hypothetical protein
VRNEMTWDGHSSHLGPQTRLNGTGLAWRHEGREGHVAGVQLRGVSRTVLGYGSQWGQVSPYIGFRAASFGTELGLAGSTDGERGDYGPWMRLQLGPEQRHFELRLLSDDPLLYENLLGAGLVLRAARLAEVSGGFNLHMVTVFDGEVFTADAPSPSVGGWFSLKVQPGWLGGALSTLMGDGVWVIRLGITMAFESTES